MSNPNDFFRRAGNINIATDILDEISLEGLDGITIKTLFWRLANHVSFSFGIDDYSKPYIWSIVLQLQDVKFFLLPSERDETKLLLQSYNGETRNELAVIEREMYPISAVSDSVEAGSCAHFSTRKDISVVVRTKTLDECLHIFGSKLVIVANYNQRLKALCPHTVLPHFVEMKPLFDYILLEAIGRSRWMGLNTTGPGSARGFSKDAMQLHYYLSHLVEKGLVKKIIVSGNYRIYLTRFNNHIEKYFGSTEFNEGFLLKQLIIEFQKQPNWTMSRSEIRVLKPVLHKTKRMTQFFNSEAAKKHFIPTKVRCPKGRSRKRVALDLPELLVDAYKLLCVEPDEDTNEVEEVDEEDDEYTNDRSNADLELNTPIYYQIFYQVLKSGSSGISIMELCQKLDVRKKVLLNYVLKMLKSGIFRNFPVQKGRQKITMYKLSDREMKKDDVIALQERLYNISSEKVPGPAAEPTSAPAPGPSCKEQIIEEAEDMLPKITKEKESKRKLYRMGFIMRTIKTHRALLKTHLFHKLRIEEKDLGYSDEMARRTFYKITDQLAKDGLIQILKKDDIEYYTDLSFQVEDLTPETSVVMQERSTVDDQIQQIVLDSDIAMEALRNVPNTEKLTGRVFLYNYSPKFLRLSALHDLMFYLVRGYTGDTTHSQEDLLKQVESSCSLDPKLRETLPRLYSDHISSYMFIPPLTSLHALAPGWCSFAQILMSTPLSVYRELAGLPKDNAEVEMYLKHPILRNYPMSHLPASLRAIFLSAKPVGKIMADIKRLCFMGLVRFGSKFGLKKTYLRALYVNTRATIYDTRPSAPGYFQVEQNRSYESKSFHFRTILDVKKYWRELFTICLETKLGIGKTSGRNAVIVREHEKEEFIQSCVVVNHAQALSGDTGFLPGDRSGAGGLDTNMFAFYRPNWFNNVSKKANPKKTVRPHSVPKKSIKRTKTNGAKQIVSTKKKSKMLDEEDGRLFPTVGTKNRVQWTKEEDNIIMLCKVAMNFLYPVQRTCVKIPHANIQTILRRYIGAERCLDKTGQVIARRITHFRIKSRSAIAGLVKILHRLPEAKTFSSKCTPKEIADIKPSSPDLPELKARLSSVFMDLVHWLIDHYVQNGAVLILQDLEIPDSIEEFNEIYDNDDKKTVTLTEDRIREDSIRAVLLSSLASATDKTSQASQLLDIYRQYSEPLLRTAIRRLHRQRVITLRKRSGTEILRMPAASSPYKFSQRFGFLLNTKYCQSTYHEAYRELNLLLCCPVGSFMEMNLNRCGPASFVLGGLSYISFKTCVPEQFIVLDTQMVPKAVSKKIMNRYEELLKHSDPFSVMKETKGQKRSLEINDDDDSEPETKKIHLMEDADDESEKMDVDIVREASTGVAPGRAAADVPVGFRSARIALYLLREIATQEITPNLVGKRPVDVFVVNTSKVEAVPAAHLARDYGCSDKSPKEILQSVLARSNLQKNCVESNDSLERLLQNVSPAEAEVIKDLENYIFESGVTGVTLLEARNYCSYASDALKRLVEANIVCKLGVSEVRLVSQRNSPAWHISSYKITRLAREKMKPSEVSMADVKSGTVLTKKLKDKKLVASNSLKLTSDPNKVDRPTPVHVVMRPWLRVDGTINRRVLDRLLGSVLGHIMLTPGALASSTTSKFSPALSPVWTLELIEILQDIGCITRRTIHRQKPTLFTTGDLQIAETLTGFELEDEIVVEPKVDAIITLGKFIGNKSYSKDILTNISYKTPED